MIKYSLKCEILSPLHIGTGEGIEPFYYIIKEHKFYKISLDNFLFELPSDDRTAFERLIDEGRLNKIRKFIGEKVNVGAYSIYSTDVTPEVEEIYNSKLDDIQNQLLINPFVRTAGRNRPYVPGSSIKGAIRTALINQIAQNSNLPKPQSYREEFEFESKVLGCTDAKNDPFRGIKIRDGILPSDSTIITKVKNVTKDRSGNLSPNNIQLICEITYSMISKRPVVFEVELIFDDNLFSTNYLSGDFIIEDIKEACNGFYLDKLQAEHDKFYKNSIISSSSMALLNEEIEDNAFLLRIGRFSGVESVTIDNYRNPRPPGKGIWGKSRNLAEMKYPMGWIKIEISQ